MSLELWIPETARDRPRPVWRCESCGLEFPAGPETARKRIRHAIKCAERNEEVIAQERQDELISDFGSVLTEDQEGEYLEKRQKALREGVKGKGLN